MTFAYIRVSTQQQDLENQRYGIKLGRRLGSKNKHSKLESKKEYIEMCLASGKSRYYLKKHLSCHSHTLNNYLIENKLNIKYNIKGLNRY